MDEQGRNQRGAVMLTPEEKRAAVIVAGLRGITESDVYRDFTVSEWMAEYERVRAIHGKGAEVA